MKKLILFLMLSAFVFSLAGCGSDTLNTNESREPVKSDQSENMPVQPEREFSDFSKRSLVSVGNTERFLNAVAKARNGENVTIAYLGGSITQGVGATTDNDCYAYKSYECFTNLYANGDTDKVRYVNAGIAGTPSTLGIVRSQKDIIDYSPDIVFVEFAVNDGSDQTSREVYESLVKRLINSPSKPCVMLIFTVLEGGYSAREHMQAVGEHYNLGMISVADSITPEIENGNMEFIGDYAQDAAHPNDKGHAMISEFIDYLFYMAERANSEPYQLPDEPIYSDKYAELYNISEDSAEIVSMGDFEIGKANCFTYENGFVHKKDKGDEPLVFSAEFKSLLLSFRQNNNKNMGSAEIIIDGKSVGSISSYNENGWGNIETKIFTADTSGLHKVEIKMSESDSQKELWLLDIGCVPG